MGRRLTISWPANHTLLQVCLPLFVVVYHSSVGELPDPCFHLCLGFGVNSQGKPFPAFVEAISQKFYLSGICHCRFLPVHLQKQFLLDKRNDVFQGLIRTGFASAEDFPLFIRLCAFVFYPHLSVDNVENSILRTLDLLVDFLSDTHILKTAKGNDDYPMSKTKTPEMDHISGVLSLVKVLHQSVSSGTLLLM